MGWQRKFVMTVALAAALGSPSAQACTARELPARGRIDQQTDQASINAAFDFLNAQMDRYHRVTVVSGADFSTFYPGGRMGDVDDIEVTRTDASSSTRSVLRADFRPRASGGNGWAGIYFLYPDGNWGQFPG